MSFRNGISEKMKSLKAKKMANKESVLATDWAIQQSTALGGLVFFKRKFPVRPLRRGQTRFWKKTRKCSPEVQAASLGHKWRSCVKDIDGTSCLEVIWSERGPSMFETLDMGSSSWQVQFPLYDSNRGGIGGFWSCDPPHRRHRHGLPCVEPAQFRRTHIRHHFQLAIALHTFI